MMNGQQAVEFIWGAEVYGSVLNLDTMKVLLEKLGNPQKQLKFVHVAGTNGKGSTCAYLSSILQKAGYKTGLYISPDIQDFGERMQCNGEYITDDELGEITELIKDKSLEMVAEGLRHPTVFELTTAIAFVYFLRKSAISSCWKSVSAAERTQRTSSTRPKSRQSSTSVSTIPSSLVTR